MESFRAIQLNMLIELDEVCRKQSIPYILSAYTARSAFLDGAFPKKSSVPTIAMRYADYMRLEKMLHSTQRVWESSFVNRVIPKTSIRYSDSNSFFCRIDEITSYHNKGLAVDVEIIRDVVPKRVIERFVVFLEGLCAMSANLRGISPVYRFLCKLFIPFEKAVLHLVYTKRWKNAKRSRIGRFPKKSIEFPNSFLENRDEVQMEGHFFYVPSEMEQYMQVEFGEKWRQGDVAKSAEDFQLTVMDADVPWVEMENFVAELSKQQPSVNWIHWYILRGKMRTLRRKIERNWDILFCTKARFHFAKQLLPHKETIAILRSGGEYEKLQEILYEYLEEMESQYKKGFVLYFNEEIFNAALWVLEKSQKANYANKLRSMLSSEHQNIISIEGLNDD